MENTKHFSLGQKKLQPIWKITPSNIFLHNSMARQFLEINVKSAFVRGITKILDTIVSSNLCQLSNLREAPMSTIVVMVSKQKSQNSLTALILIAMLQILIWGVLKIRKRLLNLAMLLVYRDNMAFSAIIEWWVKCRSHPWF